MKAVIQSSYGPPDALVIKDVPIPSPSPGELLIRIHACAINDFDWSLVRGKPMIYRLLFGLFKPKYATPGIELSGVVAEVGEGVTQFQKGDEVYGDISEFGWGSFAEYACVKEKSVVLKPTGMSHLQAAAISHASMLAYQGLVTVGNIQRGQKILINGAGGGMGMYAYQIAKEFDAEITGVDSEDKLEGLSAMGFDQVLDYKQVDFTKTGIRYDLILDAKTTRSPGSYRRSLTANGVYVTVGGHLTKLIRLLVAGKLGKKNLHIVALKPNKDLAYIHDLFEQGKIDPLIDGPYSLEEIPDALNYFGAGQHKGKVVVSILSDT